MFLVVFLLALYLSKPLLALAKEGFTLVLQFVVLRSQ